ncbi:MAG: thymidine kinase [Bacilli bacterium]|jgi:thymidine kinase
MELITKPGWIEVICGPMFSGKSEELIRRVKRLEYARKEVLVFKPAIDNRYATGEVVSHAKRATKSFDVSKAQEILAHVGPNTYAVAVDEVQFLDSGILAVAQILADRGLRVILAGLDTDFRGETFEVVAQLLAKAEYIVKLAAICVVCGAPATRTQRIIAGRPAHYGDPIIKVGASEAYEARCRHCHDVPGKPQEHV